MSPPLITVTWKLAVCSTSTVHSRAEISVMITSSARSESRVPGTDIWGSGAGTDTGDGGGTGASRGAAGPGFLSVSAPSSRMIAYPSISMVSQLCSSLKTLASKRCPLSLVSPSATRSMI